jgi:hypothetical protein
LKTRVGQTQTNISNDSTQKKDGAAHRLFDFVNNSQLRSSRKPNGKAPRAAKFFAQSLKFSDLI